MTETIENKCRGVICAIKIEQHNYCTHNGQCIHQNPFSYYTVFRKESEVTQKFRECRYIRERIK